MVLGVLRGLGEVLLLDRRRPRLVGDRPQRQRTRAQRREHALGVLRGVAQRGGVQQEHRWPVGTRQARGGDHRLDDALQGRQQAVDPLQQVVEILELEHPRVVGHGLRPGVGAQVKARDDAEEPGAGAPRGPQQVGVLVLVGMDELAVGGDHVDPHDALTRPSPAPAVPAVA
jgi:hypothetical protein